MIKILCKIKTAKRKIDKTYLAIKKVRIMIIYINKSRIFTMNLIKVFNKMPVYNNKLQNLIILIIFRTIKRIKFLNFQALLKKMNYCRISNRNYQFPVLLEEIFLRCLILIAANNKTSNQNLVDHYQCI